MLKTRQLTIDDIEQLTKLFDLYRQFYGQSSDIPAARAFIAQRLENQDSHLIGAFESDKFAGFTQLYPSFSSVGMKPKLILNDMFVLKEFRRSGVARALLRAAEQLGSSIGAASLVLATQNENSAAQQLYESTGWVPEANFVYYNLAISSDS